MKANDATIQLIKRHEGFIPHTYRDPVGVLTIGYGTTKAAGVGIDPQLGMVIREVDAAEYLRKSIDKFAAMIEPHFIVQPNENEFGAFVSLVYNIGPGAFLKSTALRKFNEGDRRGAIEGIRMWNKAGGRVFPGLVKRREDEIALFNEPVRSIGLQPVHQTGGFIAWLLSLFGVK